MVQANGSLFSKFYPRIILWPFGYFHYFESLLTAHPYLLSLVGLKAGNFALTDEWTTQRVEVLEPGIHPLICPSWNMHSEAYQHGYNYVAN
jgi:hypothetical protein